MQVCMALLNEGIDVWRPVELDEQGKLLVAVGEEPDCEEWEFKPRSVVVALERRKLSGGEVNVIVQSGRLSGRSDHIER